MSFKWFWRFIDIGFFQRNWISEPFDRHHLHDDVNIQTGGAVASGFALDLNIAENTVNEGFYSVFTREIYKNRGV
jgi:hypothetical protein